MISARATTAPRECPYCKDSVSAEDPPCQSCAALQHRACWALYDYRCGSCGAELHLEARPRIHVFRARPALAETAQGEPLPGETPAWLEKYRQFWQTVLGLALLLPFVLLQEGSSHADLLLLTAALGGSLLLTSAWAAVCGVLGGMAKRPDPERGGGADRLPPPL